MRCRFQTLVQRQAEEAREEPVQTKKAADQTPEVTPDLEGRIQSLRSSGQPLSESTRNFFESRFGYDFGSVRVHADSQADEAARSLNAQAFTIGRDVFFSTGRYEPHTSQGRWLLAHELTRTVQQQPPKPLAATSPTVQSCDPTSRTGQSLKLRRKATTGLAESIRKGAIA